MGADVEQWLASEVRLGPRIVVSRCDQQWLLEGGGVAIEPVSAAECRLATLICAIVCLFGPLMRIVHEKGFTTPSTNVYFSSPSTCRTLSTHAGYSRGTLSTHTGFTTPSTNVYFSSPSTYREHSTAFSGARRQSSANRLPVRSRIILGARLLGTREYSRVLKGAWESTVGLSPCLLVDDAGVAELVLPQLVDRVDLLAAACEREPFHVPERKKRRNVCACAFLCVCVSA